MLVWRLGKRGFLVFTAGVAWLAPLTGLAAPHPQHRRRAVPALPAFANVLGVRLGVDTERVLERRLGKGKVVTGGHPNSGRLWHYKSGLYLLADGFDYVRRSILLDALLFSEWRGRLGETRELAKRGLGVWGGLRVGMTPEECLALLKHTLPKPHITAEKIVWQQDVPGWREGKPTTLRYEAALSFTKGRLRSLLLDSD